ncbi:MAG: DJ-1 family protein, partial [Deltaproteobacteria bacterium]|nr:DJ-1 family protein [Deltaproteobacteria bacterium]
MASAAVFFINGFEEIEALTSVDVLRRGQVKVDTV